MKFTPRWNQGWNFAEHDVPAHRKPGEWCVKNSEFLNPCIPEVQYYCSTLKYKWTSSNTSASSYNNKKALIFLDNKIRYPKFYVLRVQSKLWHRFLALQFVYTKYESSKLRTMQPEGWRPLARFYTNIYHVVKL